MLVEERYQRIVTLVNERGSIRVSELSQICDVTEETIRRDLAKLEKMKRLVRSHGGAVSILQTPTEVPYTTREVMNAEAKKKIAKEALALIHEGERIFLDASTTAWYTASSLPNLPLTVLTNSVKVTMALAEKDQIEVISLGGHLTHNSLSFVGPLAERSLETYYVNKAFLSCQGVHTDRGLSDSNENQARLKQKVISSSEHVVLMADSSKMGVKAFTKIADLHSVHTFVTDQELSADIKAKLNELTIETIIAKA
ncbi:putative transcriptional regulator [Bacillus sp. TS-2]|nr:putative transcriptional regulator [Bacillus sp. TS-2]